MRKKSWEKISVLLRQVVAETNLLTLEAAQRAFDRAPDVPLTDSEMQQIVESVQQRAWKNGSAAEPRAWDDLLFVTELSANHPPELVRCDEIYEVHPVGTDFDFSSMDNLAAELTRFSHAETKWVRSHDALICEVISTGSEFEAGSRSVIGQGTTRWQTQAEGRGLAEHRLDHLFESYCSWPKAEEEDWISYWKN